MNEFCVVIPCELGRLTTSPLQNPFKPFLTAPEPITPFETQTRRRTYQTTSRFAAATPFWWMLSCHALNSQTIELSTTSFTTHRSLLHRPRARQTIATCCCRAFQSKTCFQHAFHTQDAHSVPAKRSVAFVQLVDRRHPPLNASGRRGCALFRTNPTL